MRISMDRFGNVVQAGEGTFRVPMGVHETDNTLSNPAAAAEMILERERNEYATMAAAQDNRDEASRVRAARSAFINRMAQDQEEYVDEAMASETGGEHPLTYLAAIQSMAGNSSEQWTPLSGYLLSQDGVPAFDRTMNGYQPMRGSMGDWLDDLKSTVSQAQSTVSDIQDIESQAMDLKNQVVDVLPVSQSAPAPSYMPAVATKAVAQLKAQVTGFMSQKYFGVPAPLLALAVVGAGVYVYKKKK
jgi:hypothetical protein